MQTLSPARNTRALEAGTPLFQQIGKCAKLTIQGDVVVVTNGFHESLGIASSNVTRLHTHSSSVTSTSEFSIMLADWKYLDKVIRMGLDLNRVSEGSPVLQFSFFASLAFRLPSVIFFFCCCWIVLLIECQLFLFACCREFIFFFFPFVSLPCYLYPCVVVFTSLPFVAFVSSGLKKSFTSSSHLFFSLPTALHVLILVLHPGFQFSSFPYPSFFWWRCYSHPQSPFHSSVHFGRTRNLGPPHSISLSESSAKETSLSWSQSVSVLLPSCVSLGVLWLSFLSQCRFSDFHVACHLLFLYFLLVCTIGRSIFRFAYSINLSCSFVKVHVPHA